MPLTLEQLQEIQADAMADDIEIDMARMSIWTEDQAREFFETGEEPAPRHKIFGAFGRSSRSIISSLFTPRRAHTPNASPSKQEPVASTPLDSPTGEVDAEDLERMSMVRESVSEAHARFSTASQDVSARSSTRRSFSGMPSSDSGLRVDGTPRGGSDSPALQAIAIDASPWLAKDDSMVGPWSS